VLERVEIATSVRAVSAARRNASSPSGWRSRWSAMGATITGAAMCVPSAVVSVETELTSRRIRGRIASRSQAARLARSVTSSPAPAA
jgi:hypothetical protein